MEQNKSGIQHKKKEVSKTDGGSVDSLITQAIQSNVSVETMEKLLNLREKVKRELAREEFVKALSRFQSDCPIIEKTKKVLSKDGSVRYQYAPLDSIINQIKTVLVSNELSYTWDTKNEDGFIISVATITHILGHSESSEFKVPIDKGGFMTEPQKYASALTFAKRYSLCNALGIATADEDTDATDVGKEKEAKSSKSKIIFLLKSLGHQTKTKEQVERAVSHETGLALDEENFEEIIGRLEVVLKEKQEYDSPKVQ